MNTVQRIAKNTGVLFVSQVEGRLVPFVSRNMGHTF